MTDDPAPPLASPGVPRRSNDLLRLAELLAERVLVQREAGESIPETHIHALLDAAILLDKYEIELPPALGRIVDQVDAARAEAEDGASNLAWLLRPFQGVKD